MTVAEIVGIISDQILPMTWQQQNDFLNEIISELEGMVCALEDEQEEEEGGD